MISEGVWFPITAMALVVILAYMSHKGWCKGKFLGFLEHFFWPKLDEDEDGENSKP
jgi:hypothetical protein